jgi:hypothetical protein
MKISLLSIILLFGIFHTHAQNPGYFGKKNVIDFTFIAQSPVFGNIGYQGGSNQLLKLENGNLVESKDRFDWGFRFNYSHPTKRDFALGIEAGYDYYSVQRNYRSDADYYTNYYFEKLDVKSLSIMPKLEFSNEGGLLPMGISHQIGIGIRMVKPVDKAFSYAQTDFYASNVNIPITTEGAEYLKYTGSAVKGMTLMYALNFRTPLTKSLLLNYGIRYTLNFMSKTYFSAYNSQETYPNVLKLTENEFQSIVRTRKQLSFIQANIGLSYAF